MKKIILVLCLLAATLNSFAQNFISDNFLAVNSLAVSNILQYTNISCYGVNASNAVGTVWTNLNGTRVVVASGAASETAKLTKDIDLISSDRSGRPMPIYWTNPYTNVLADWQPSPQNLFIRIVGQSGANSAVVFTFVPVPDGDTDTTAAADVWKVSITANGAIPVTLITNIPSSKWFGCKALRLQTIVNADVDASSRVDVLKLKVNQWMP
jgi:hypothetical protein